MSRAPLIAGALVALVSGCAQEIIPYEEDVVRIFNTPRLESVSPALVVAGTNEMVELSFTLTQPATEAMAVTIELDPPELGTASAGVVVAAGAQAGTISFNTGSARMAGVVRLASGTVIDVPLVVSGLVISEIATGSTASEDEFIELYNPTQKPISLSGVTVMYRSAAGSSYATRATLSGQIAAHGYFLLTANDPTYKGETGDARFTSGLAAAGGVLRLLRNGAIVEDHVAWGTAENNLEGAPADAAVGEVASIERKALPTSDATQLAMNGEHAAYGNGVDTQNNLQDFVVRAQREPQNAASSVREPAAVGP